MPISCNRLLRSDISTFAFKEHCLFCGRFITDSEKRLKSGVVHKACNSRNDLWSANVQSRLLSVNDLPENDAIYHQACSLNFRKGEQTAKKYRDDSQDELLCKPLGRPQW